MTKAWTDIPLDSLLAGKSPYPELENDCVYLWKFPLNTELQRRLAAKGYLSDSENEYTSKIRNELRLQQFIIGRSLLRQLLSALLQQAPDSIVLKSNAYGKPELNSPANCEFNVSHSRDSGVIAVCRQSPVGVDIQHHRDDIDLCRFSKRFFTKAENTFLQNQPDDQQARAFFRIWTRKEAIAKAAGQSITFALSSIQTHNEIDSDSTIEILYAQQPWYVTNIAVDEQADENTGCSLALAQSGKKSDTVKLFNLIQDTVTRQ